MYILMISKHSVDPKPAAISVRTDRKNMHTLAHQIYIFYRFMLVFFTLDGFFQGCVL